mgnify:CR=1 FL=1
MWEDANNLLGQLTDQQSAQGSFVDAAFFHRIIEAGPLALEAFALAEQSKGRERTRGEERIQRIHQGIPPLNEDFGVRSCPAR